MFLTVGLPGAGKTTSARQLAKEHSALRLTPEDWMIPLFGEPEVDGKRDVLEGRLLGEQGVPHHEKRSGRQPDRADSTVPSTNSRATRRPTAAASVTAECITAK